MMSIESWFGYLKAMYSVGRPLVINSVAVRMGSRGITTRQNDVLPDKGNEHLVPNAGDTVTGGKAAPFGPRLGGSLVAGEQ